MARETVAQRNERLAKEREARLEAQMSAYPMRLMDLLERVTAEPTLTLTVKNGRFNVEDRNDRYRSDYFLTYAWSEGAQVALEDLTSTVERLEEERAEAERLYKVRNDAMRKVRETLNQEERELLGLE